MVNLQDNNGKSANQGNQRGKKGYHTPLLTDLGDFNELTKTLPHTHETPADGGTVDTYFS